MCWPWPRLAWRLLLHPTPIQSMFPWIPQLVKPTFLRLREFSRFEFSPIRQPTESSLSTSHPMEVPRWFALESLHRQLLPYFRWLERHQDRLRNRHQLQRFHPLQTHHQVNHRQSNHLLGSDCQPSCLLDRHRSFSLPPNLLLSHHLYPSNRLRRTTQQRAPTAFQWSRAPSQRQTLHPESELESPDSMTGVSRVSDSSPLVLIPRSLRVRPSDQQWSVFAGLPVEGPDVTHSDDSPSHYDLSDGLRQSS